MCTALIRESASYSVQYKDLHLLRCQLEVVAGHPSPQIVVIGPCRNYPGS
jgi:hypothetical protein